MIVKKEYITLKLKDFLDYLNALQLDYKTKERILSNLNDFFGFNDSFCFAPMTKQSFLDYKTHLMQLNYKSSTINNKLTALNHMIKFLNLNLPLKCLPKDNYIEDFINKIEYNKLLNVCIKHKRYYKFYLIIKTFATTGIRINELKQITVKSLITELPTVTNKGKTRHIFIKDELIDELINYCKINNITSGSIFVTKNNNPLPHNFINKKLKEVASMAKIKKDKIHAHNFRVYFANSYYNKYHNIYKLAKILGHESIITTFGYLRGYLDDCKNDINNL